MPTPAELLAVVREVFVAKRPEQFTLNSPQAAAYGDEEGDRAERIFASHTPDSLLSTDVGIDAGWPECFLTEPALDYYMPGFVRLALEANGERGFQLDDFLSVLAPHRISRMSREQKLALADVLHSIANQVDERSKELVIRRLRRLRA